MDTEQEQVRLEPDILLEVQSEQIRGLMEQNVQLGAYVRQLKMGLERERDENVRLRSALDEKGKTDGASEVQ